MKVSTLRKAYKLSGEGRALGNTQLVQDKAYFEVKILRKGEVRIGVAKANREALGKGVGLDYESWGLCFSTVEGSSVLVHEGDVVGCVVDQSDFPAKLSYSVNGNTLEAGDVSGMRGPLLPAVSISAGAEVEVAFSAELFAHEPPNGASAIIFSQNFLF